MSSREVEALVVGAGVAGLAAAAELAAAGVETLVVDGSDRPGGVARSDALRGYLVEAGPNTVRVKAPALGLLRRLGLEGLLLPASPASRRRCLLHAGRLEPLPAGPLAAVRTPLLSARGKLRLLAEPLVRRGDPTGESVAQFLGRRLGPEAVERLVGPFLTGVYAGDERQLGAEAVFPALVALEREHRSLALGALAGLARRRGERGLRGIYSTPRGLGALAEALARRLGEGLWLGTRARALRREGAGWAVELAGPGGEVAVRTRRALLATPAPAAAALLAGVDAEAAALAGQVAYAPIAAVALGVDPAAAREPIEGFGFLVPRSAGLGLLGCLFMSRLFPGRAPPGRELLHCMLGGTRWPEAVDQPDDALLARLRGELEGSLGLREVAEVVAIHRWPRAVAQPDGGHVRRVAALRARLASRPGLALAGGWLDGVAVADALASGLRAARELLAGDLAATR